MHLLNFDAGAGCRIGLLNGEEVIDLTSAGLPQSLDDLVGADDLVEWVENAASRSKSRVACSDIRYLPPIINARKGIAVGLNCVDHAAEANFEPPEFPVLFSRFPSSWVGHQEGLAAPKASPTFDYEGELAVIIGKPGRAISREAALDHVAGYSIFNDGSVREYQRKFQQWMMGKNFDRSGGFGPYFVPAHFLPDGASGLTLQTRLNGERVQHSSTDKMIFDVATLIAFISEAFELVPGDIIITGTPSGVGGARTPQLFMKPGDVCEVEIEGIGILSNPIIAE